MKKFKTLNAAKFSTVNLDKFSTQEIGLKVNNKRTI